MDGAALQAFQKELSCAVCRNTFLDPVTIDCGHSFCRPCLCLSWEERQTPPGTCPACREPTKHYWELSAKGSSTWAVGVCRDSAVGRDLPMDESQDLFLLLAVKSNTYDSLFTTSPLVSHYMEMPLDLVGVFLDLDSGTVSFWNVAKSSLIWRYPNGSLQFPVRPVFHRGNLLQ
ncbi:tripartite motif-containing protein 43B-like [Thomomys bottae]